MRRLAPYQEAVVQRVAADCRATRGHLLLHLPGSGKTTVALSLFANMPHRDEDTKHVVLVPAALTSTYGSLDGGEAAALFPNAHNRIAFLRGVRVVTYDGVTGGVPSLRLLLAGGRGEQLASLLRGAVVVADEAHYLLPLLRDPRFEGPLKAALRGASRVVLMTGTPIMEDASDLGALLQVVSSTPVPADPVGFLEAFGVPAAGAAAKGWSMGVAGMLLPVVAGLVQTQFLTTASQHAFAGSFAAQASWGLALRAMAAGHGGGADLVKFVGALVLSRAATIASLAFVEAAVALEAVKVDEAALLRVAAPVTSYFDYESVVTPPGVPPPRLSFPRRQEHHLTVTYTPLQTAALTAFARAKLPTTHQAALGLRRGGAGANASSAAQADPSVFRAFSRAIGNLSEEALEGGQAPRWVDTTDEGTRLPVTEQAWGDQGPPYPPPFRVKGGQALHAGSPLPTAHHVKGGWSCPKFEAVLARLVALRDAPPADTCFAVHPATRAFVRDAEGAKVPTPAERYLPLVYTNFEEAGLHLFSAFLRCRGLRHIVVRSDDGEARRAAVMRFGADTRYAVGDVDAPLCVLLHPDVREGLSFVHNPELILLEPIIGHGNHEQVVGRVLRRYGGAPEAGDEARPLKRVLQVEAGWGQLAYLRQLKAKLVDWWRNTRHLEPGTALGAYTHRNFGPDALVLQETAAQAKLLRALGAALTRVDDVAVAAQCRSERGPPRCRLCLRGPCACDAVEGGEEPCGGTKFPPTPPPFQVDGRLDGRTVL